MYHEAVVEVFYPNATFHFYENDLRVALKILQAVPPKALARMQRIKFTMTVGQCDGWADGALASGYPAKHFGNVVEFHCAGSTRPALNYRADWREVLGFMARHVDLSQLQMGVDMDVCGWMFLDGPFERGVDMASMFRFYYDFVIDVVAAMCCYLKGIGNVRVEMSAMYKGMAPWLEREVIGYGDGQVPAPPSWWRAEALLVSSRMA